MYRKSVLIFAITCLVALAFGQFTTPRASAVSIIVNTPDDVLNKWDGFCSLREAIRAANNNSAPMLTEGECPAGSDTETDVIVLANGVTYLLSIPGTNENNADTGDLDILDNTADLDLQVIVQDGGSATVDADGLDRAFHVLFASVEFNNVSMTNGDATLSVFGFGGNLLNEQGNVTLNGGQINQGQADAGGGISSFSNTPGTGSLIVNQTQVALNQAIVGGGISGGGLYSKVTLNDMIIRSNTSNLRGGGLAVEGGHLEVISSTVSLNTTSLDGGGMIVWVTSHFTLTNTLIQSNDAPNGDGGGLYLDTHGSKFLQGLTFSQNSAGQYGGGIFDESDQYLPVRDSLFFDNQADIRGGAIYADYPQTFNAHFEGNSAPFGGAVYADVAVDVYESSFSGNFADVIGGAIHARFADILQSQFTENTALQFGGAVRTMAYLTVEESTFANNHADLAGGGIYMEGPEVGTGSFILASTFEENTTDQNGGGLYLGPDFSLDLLNSTLAENEATGLGRGIYISASAILTTTNVTFAANHAAGMQGSALYNARITYLKNTLLSNHAFTTCETVNPADLISLGHNLSESADCNLTAPGDLPATPAGLTDLPQDNGGPTETWALTSSSAAVNAGNNTACAGGYINGVDPRGVAHFGPCDIGAFELILHLFLPSVTK